jgi:hypothetical protein
MHLKQIIKHLKSINLPHNKWRIRLRQLR